MIEATKNQEEILQSHTNKRGWFTCPQCNSECNPEPSIENKGEEDVQVYCLYGCGYINLIMKDEVRYKGSLVNSEDYFKSPKDGKYYPQNPTS